MIQPDPQTPIVKGWCPGAHRPMRSGDGLVVRVRPFRAALTPAQVRGLCALARRYGNGTLDLTSRANLQIRAVSDADYPDVLAGLADLNLLDHDPAVEAHRNVLMAPDWQPGDVTDRLYGRLMDALPRVLALPDKMGFALDTGAASRFADCSADFRFERDAGGGLLLRADGAAKGWPVRENGAIDALLDMAQWFIDTGGAEAGRMARHLARTPMAGHWQTTQPRPQAAPLAPGATPEGLILGAPFGTLPADRLDAAMDLPGLLEMRVMPGRLFWLLGTDARALDGFISGPDAALLRVHACPGAPLCPQATVATRALAARLANRVSGSLHVSGCAKGCAWPRRANLTLTGRDGHFDLAHDAAPWEEPVATGLSPEDLSDLTGTP
ncbi:MAG: cobalamin biosynthesis protein CobG [Alphaproteobacteria bacterium]|jgi:precorrin-3B synthase|nr:cobalamin biosynthesis protein CobG [Alphaproteobacteria bacterium]